MASTSEPSWDLRQQQSVIRLLDLLRRPDYRRYSIGIKNFLQELNKYEAKTFERLMADPATRDRWLISLENVLKRWQARNPLSVSDLNDVEAFSIYKDFYMAIYNQDWDLVRDQVEKLGFSQTVVENLIQDIQFRRQTFRILSDRLQDWHAKHPWLEFQPLTLPDTFESFQDILTQNYIRDEFARELDASGPKSLRYNALMSNPKSIAAAEEELGLPITGNKDRFIQNYRANYFTLACIDSQERIGGHCVDLLNKNGPFELNVQAVVNNMDYVDSFLRETLIPNLIKYGRFDVIEAAIERYVPENDNLGREKSNRANLLMAIAAAWVTQDNFEEYEKYFSQAKDIYQRIILDNEFPDILADDFDEIREYLLIIAKILLGNAVTSGDKEMIKLVGRDFKELSGVIPGAVPPDLIDSVLSSESAAQGKVDILQYLDKELGWLNPEGAIQGAITTCNSQVIAYLRPFIVQQYFTPINEKRIQTKLVYPSLRSGCAEMLALCIQLSGQSPNIVTLYSGKLHLSEDFTPAVLDLLLTNYMDLIPDVDRYTYLARVIRDGKLELFKVLMKYPTFQDKIKGMQYFLAAKASGMYDSDTSYKIARYALHHGYVKPDDALKDLEAAVWHTDAGVVKALVEYYIDHNINIKRDYYQRLREKHQEYIDRDALGYGTPLLDSIGSSLDLLATLVV